MTVNELINILGGDVEYRIEPLENFMILAQGVVDEYFEEKCSAREKYGTKEIYSVTVDNGVIVIILDD